MECLAHGWNWINFLRGFVVAAGTSAASCFLGPLGGAIIGALLGAIEAAFTKGDIIMGALFGALFGGVSGFAPGFKQIANGLCKRELAILFLLNGDSTLVTCELSAYSTLF